MKILLVIPAYNEEKSIVSVVEDAKKHGYDYIVINDGSTDHTIDICKEHGINVLDLPRNSVSEVLCRRDTNTHTGMDTISTSKLTEMGSMIFLPFPS